MIKQLKYKSKLINEVIFFYIVFLLLSDPEQVRQIIWISLKKQNQKYARKTHGIGNELQLQPQCLCSYVKKSIAFI